MSRTEQFEFAIAAIIAGIFGAPLFQRWLEGVSNTRDMLTLALIMLCVSIYGLLRVYIIYREASETTQHNTSRRNSKDTSRNNVRVTSHQGFRKSSRSTSPSDKRINRLRSNNENPIAANTNLDNNNSAKQQKS